VIATRRSMKGVLRDHLGIADRVRRER